MRQKRRQDEEQQDGEGQRKCDESPLNRPLEDLLRISICVFIRFLLQGNFGRVEQALYTQAKSVPKQRQATQERDLGQPAAVNTWIERLGMDHDVSLRIAHGHG